MAIHPDNPGRLIDTLGNIIDFGQLVRASMPSIKPEKIAVKSMDQKHIIFSYDLKEGIADRNGKVLIAPVFARISHFDNASKLAWVEMSENGKYSYGYVNEQGVVVLIKGGGSTW